MLQQLAKNAVFILFPILLAAIVFLGRLNLQAMQRVGEWGERSVAESTYLLAREKVDRVEEEIISTDNFMLRAIHPSRLQTACANWQTDETPVMIKAAAIYDTNDQVIQFFHRQSDPAEARNIFQLLIAEIIPHTSPYESDNEIKHYHMEIDNTYHLITTRTITFETQPYTTLFLYDNEEILGYFFRKILRDVGKDRIVNVVDDKGQILFGDDLHTADDFSVARRFPSTFYRWKLQIAPLSSTMYTSSAQQAQLTSWVLIPASFGVIVFGILFLGMIWARERRLNTLKSEFISNTSHELKTPLALIRMFSELLAMKQVQSPEKIAQYHEIILKETERLTSLIDNVLDFSKIERGGDVYHFERFNPREAVMSAVDIYRHRVESIGAQLTLDAADDLPTIEADRDAFTLVLLNLIDNAVKYATGTDIIGIHLYTRNRFLFLDVYDRGQGIPTAYLKRVFERFYRYRGTDNASSKQRGSGIGLSLVKHIAKAHGGYATVTSTPGVETRFSVRFPIK